MARQGPLEPAFLLQPRTGQRLKFHWLRWLLHLPGLALLHLSCPAASQLPSEQSLSLSLPCSSGTLANGRLLASQPGLRLLTLLGGQEVNGTPYDPRCAPVTQD